MLKPVIDFILEIFLGATYDMTHVLVLLAVFFIVIRLFKKGKR